MLPIDYLPSRERKKMASFSVKNGVQLPITACPVHCTFLPLFTLVGLPHKSEVEGTNPIKFCIVSITKIVHSNIERPVPQSEDWLQKSCEKKCKLS